MHHIICDLEATCWAEERRPERMEIIEIGAVKLASPAGPVLGEFDALVRPVLEPTLSDFCRELTGIRQIDETTPGHIGPIGLRTTMVIQALGMLRAQWFKAYRASFKHYRCNA